MMTMIRRRIAVACLILASAINSLAQDKDFGMWFELDAEKRIVKRLDLSLAAAVRTRDNVTEISDVFIEPGLKFRFNDYLSVATSYRLSSRLEKDSEYYYRHKIYFDANISYPISNIKLTARLRMVRATETYIEDDEDLVAGYVGRLRFKGEYDFPSLPVTPYLYFEGYTPLFVDEGLSLDRKRFSAGAEINLTKDSAFEAGYIFQRSYKTNSYRDEHIISLAYKIKF